MLYRWLWFVCIVLAWTSCQTNENTNQPVDPQETIQAIEGAMADQVICWNKGDIPCFMETYWDNDSLVFITSRSTSYGWETALQNYLSWYPTPEAMGSLSFEIINIRVLSEESAHVHGRFFLALEKDRKLTGTFTLLWKKIDGEWKIVLDHTSG